MTLKQEQEGASEEVTEVAPDILRLQLPISLPGLGHVNTYALCDDRGVAVVDPGLPGKESWDALVTRLATAGYRVDDVHTVIVTHSHPDHFGGAGNLRHEAGADVLTHAAFRSWLDAAEGNDAAGEDLEAVTDPDRSGDPAGLGDKAGLNDTAALNDGAWNREQPWGGGEFSLPPDAEKAMAAMHSGGEQWIRAPRPSIRVAQDDIVTFANREWVAIHTPGHTNDHLCLYSPTDGIVLSGDHVLPTITPHISGLVAGADPLAQFFASLDRVAALDGATLGLPAHGHPFHDVAGRCHAIKEHHAERLDVLRQASSSLGEASVVALSQELFKPRSWGRMAQSETYAHLEHLRHSGEMTSRRIDQDLHYALAPESASASA